MTSAPQADSNGPTDRGEALAVVIDTNVVLDWLVFRNPASLPLQSGIRSGGCRWICTKAMRDEFEHVIARDALTRWSIDPPTVRAAWDQHATQCMPPVVAGAATQLRCTDTDDQKFIDLAIAERAHALLTRDRAVLRLARRALSFGVLIVTQECWNAHHAPPM